MRYKNRSATGSDLGRVCFSGTRVPVDALLDILEVGLSLDEFLEEFEGVTRAQAIAVLEFARRSLSSAELAPG